MSVFITTCIVWLLLIVVIQDFRYREISWFLIPLLIIVFVSKGLITISPLELVRFSFINCAFVGIQLALLSAYVSLKNKRLIFIVNSHLGLGDILFFIVICIAFSPANFIVFYVSSLVFALIVFVIYKLIVKNNNEHIPLAGMIALLLVIVILLKLLLPQLNFYDDSFIVSILTND